MLNSETPRKIWLRRQNTELALAKKKGPGAGKTRVLGFSGRGLHHREMFWN